MEYTIIGGGVSGLYAAYRLAQLESTGKITIVEKLDRLGGRILTERIGDHILEYGPMRFEPELQKNLANLLLELDISTKSFVPYTCPIDPPDFNKISFEEIEAIRKYTTLPPAFALLKHGLKIVLDDQWDVEDDSIYDRLRDKKKKWLKKYGSFQGRLLSEHGLWDTLAHVLTKEALDYLQHKGTFYHMISINPNAADQLCFMLDILATAKDNLITIDEGSQHLITKLVVKLNTYPNITILLHTCVTSYEEREDNKIIITTDNKNHQEIICDHAIFTCQKSAYKYINGFPQHIRMLFNSVMIVKLFKIFIILDNPPFNSQSIPGPNYNADKVPCREIHYSYSEKDKTGMVMIYGDIPSLNYWKPFIKAYGKIRSLPHKHNDKDNTHLKNHLMHYLRNIFQDTLLPFTILHYGILDWSNEPYQSGVHLWRPGYISEDIIKEMSSFGKNKNIHICGEAYSDYQGFIEGCIRTVDGVISQINTS